MKGNNKFDFLVFSGSSCYFGHLRAQSGSHAKEMIENHFKAFDLRVDDIQLHGHMTKDFEMNIAMLPRNTEGFNYV